MQHPIRLFIGIVLIALGVMGIWTASRPSQSITVDVPPTEMPDPTPTPIPATLTNAFWQATLIDDQAALSESAVTLVFTEESNLTGSDGCNTFQTEYQIGEERNITIAEGFSATQKACSETLQAQATTFTSLLTQVDRYEILGSNLNLSIGDQVVIIMTARTNPLINQWQVSEMVDSTTQLVPLIMDTTITMDFTPEGTVYGSGGCNSYTAEYTVLANQMTILPPASTLMFCETPAGVADQESLFISQLASVTSYQTTTDQLELLDASGQVLIRLIPQVIVDPI